jgi:hypothetical protein
LHVSLTILHVLLLHLMLVPLVPGNASAYCPEDPMMGHVTRYSSGNGATETADCMSRWQRGSESENGCGSEKHPTHS